MLTVRNPVRIIVGKERRYLCGTDTLDIARSCDGCFLAQGRNLSLSHDAENDNDNAIRNVNINAYLYLLFAEDRCLRLPHFVRLPHLEAMFSSKDCFIAVLVDVAELKSIT